MGDDAINMTADAIERLIALRNEPKFVPEGIYPGAPSENDRITCERSVNVMLDRLHSGLNSSPQKSFVLSEFMIMLKGFEGLDTEEREQACSYCEQVMDLLGIESSGGLLNDWLYGFDPT